MFSRSAVCLPLPGLSLKSGLCARGGFVVFSPGHATGCLGADARQHRRIIVPDVPPLLSSSSGVSDPSLAWCVCAVAMGVSLVRHRCWEHDATVKA